MVTQIVVSDKVQLLPNKKTIRYFYQACEVKRRAFNWALAEWNRQHRAGLKPNVNELDKLFNKVKREEFPWLYDEKGGLVVSNDVAQRAIKYDLKCAFQRFFRKQGGRPNFKAKRKRYSFYVSNTRFVIDNERKRIKIAKAGVIRLSSRLRFHGKPMGLTITEKAGKWFVAVQVQIDRQDRVNTGPKVGVDLGIHHLAVLSNGQVFDSPAPLSESLRSLRRMNRSFSRMLKGGRNWHKMKRRIAKKHYRIANIRKNTLHQVTARLTRTYSSIAIEDLNIQGMLKNKKLARAISDVGMYELKRQLVYKAEREGSEVKIINRWFPSSKTCSGCGAVKESMPLSKRIYECEHCGMVLDRDHNAAINIAVSAEGCPSLPGDAGALALFPTGYSVEL